MSEIVNTQRIPREEITLFEVREDRELEIIVLLQKGKDALTFIRNNKEGDKLALKMATLINGGLHLTP